MNHNINVEKSHKVTPTFWLIQYFEAQAFDSNESERVGKAIMNE